MPKFEQGGLQDPQPPAEASDESLIATETLVSSWISAQPGEDDRDGIYMSVFPENSSMSAAESIGNFGYCLNPKGDVDVFFEWLTASENQPDGSTILDKRQINYYTAVNPTSEGIVKSVTQRWVEERTVVLDPSGDVVQPSVMLGVDMNDVVDVVDLDLVLNSQHHINARNALVEQVITEKDIAIAQGIAKTALSGSSTVVDICY